MGRMIRVAVTGPSGDAGHGIVLGLRESVMSVFVLGLDFRACYAGQRYCDAAEQMPPVASDDYLPSLMAVLKRHSIDYLLCGIDSEVPFLARNVSTILEATGCRVLVPDPEFVETCSDKYLTAEWLHSLGILAPKSSRGDCFLEKMESGETASFPLIMKPRKGHSSIGVRCIASQAELEALKPLIDEHVCIQEYLPGQEYTCGLLYDAEGNLRDWLVTRRELSGGRTMIADVCHDPVFDQFIRDFGTRVFARGAINLQLRLNAAGRPAIFEINPRFSGSTIMRLAAGYNDAARLIECHVRGDVIRRQAVPTVRIIREWTCQEQPVNRTQSIRPVQVDCLVFDCGGTLLRQRPSSEAICLRVIKEMGLFIPYEKVEDAYRIVDAIHKRKSSQERTLDDRTQFYSQYNQRLAECLGIESRAAEFHACLFETCSTTSRHWEPMPGVVDVLANLSESFDLCVLANWDNNLVRVLERAKLAHFFRVIVDSATAGVEKPNPEVFEYFVRQSGVVPARAAYIGNEYEADVIGSRRAGFHPILLDTVQRYSVGVDCPYLTSLEGLRHCILSNGPNSDSMLDAGIVKP
jgi:carbamoyl-phosphate synthase large subunit